MRESRKSMPSFLHHLAVSLREKREPLRGSDWDNDMPLLTSENSLLMYYVKDVWRVVTKATVRSCTEIRVQGDGGWTRAGAVEVMHEGAGCTLKVHPKKLSDA